MQLPQKPLQQQDTQEDEEMLLTQLHEILNIDSEISELHERLESLYRQRADITSIKDSAAGASRLADDSIDLNGIDLSL